MSRSPHNLETYSTEDVLDELQAAAPDGSALRLHDIIDGYGNQPAAPGNTYFTIAAAIFRGLLAMRIRHAVSKNEPILEKLKFALDQHAARHSGMLIEVVRDEQQIHSVLDRYIVRKGVLFKLRQRPDAVFWHPSKDFKPVDAIAIHRTGHSMLHWRRRLRELVGES